ncbi:MAG TPA: PEP-CTERM sorting domain-containing protein [Verrucomicrobiae bacterium]|nr:PEP-CTERM sorting domain-containing protein [Verrucomicrobiae bacterium]
MKALRSTLTAAAVVFWTAAAGAQGNYSFTNTVSQTIPDGSASGLTLAGNFTGMNGSISDISLSLNIGNAPGSTAYNGDLYAYLAGPNGGFSVLLNRTGVGTGNAFGYNDTGFNVTFALAGSPANIHFYQAGSFNVTGGQLTGTWAPDGRTVDPLSPPSSFDASGTAGLDSFVNTNPNGTWVLFLADVSGGNTAQVNGWTLNIGTVPEPSAWALMAVGIFAFVKFRRRS